MYVHKLVQRVKLYHKNLISITLVEELELGKGCAIQKWIRMIERHIETGRKQLIDADHI